jgi:hypothetical protein
VATWPRVDNPRGQTDTFLNPRVRAATCNKYTCLSGRVDYLHAAMWPCVFITRGRMSPCSMLPSVHYDTWQSGHVATVAAIVATWRMHVFFVVMSSFSMDLKSFLI